MYFSMRKSTSESGTKKDYFACLRSSAKNTFKCLIKDTLLWCGIMSTNLKNPREQDDCKKGTLSNQPQLTCITSTALLGSWWWQLIEDMTFLGTDFEMHANWQGYTEEPATKKLLTRKSCTIASGKVQGIAAIGQATINLDSRVWKSLKDSLSKLYCMDLAEAYVTWESESSRII